MVLKKKELDSMKGSGSNRNNKIETQMSNMTLTPTERHYAKNE